MANVETRLLVVITICLTMNLSHDNGVQAAFPKSCEWMCTSRVSPVCGSDGVTYDNNCQLVKAYCRSGVTKSGDGPCPDDCPDVCPDMFSPVCGSDLNTYDNDCALGVAQCRQGAVLTKMGDGPCPDTDPSCVFRCPKHVDPVCGSDGDTYDNWCVLLVANCERGVTKVGDGECAASSGDDRVVEISGSGSGEIEIE